MLIVEATPAHHIFAGLPVESLFLAAKEERVYVDENRYCARTESYIRIDISQGSTNY